MRGLLGPALGGGSGSGSALVFHGQELVVAPTRMIHAAWANAGWGWRSEILKDTAGPLDSVLVAPASWFPLTCLPLPYKWSPLLVWKGTESHTVTQAGLDMKHSSPPVSWALGLQADTTTCSPNGKLSPSLVLVAQLGLTVLIFRLHVPLCL